MSLSTQNVYWNFFQACQLQMLTRMPRFKPIKQNSYPMNEVKGGSNNKNNKDEDVCLKNLEKNDVYSLNFSIYSDISSLQIPVDFFFPELNLSN